MFAAFSDSNKNEDQKRGRFIYTPGHLTLGAIVPHGKFVTVVALFCIKKKLISKIRKLFEEIYIPQALHFSASF